MATIDSKEIIADLLISNGRYEDDPQLYSAWSYVNSWGNETCAIFYTKTHEDMNDSPFVRDQKLLWRRDIGLTHEGAEWLTKNWRKP